MTNGEKLQETFPNMRITVCESYVQVMGENYEFNNTYPLAWWNAEYKEPCSSEIPTGSNTKNDVGVDCIDRKEFIDWINVWDITPIIKRPLIRHVQGMSSVTPIRPKGHWRNVDTNMYACSKCSHVLTIDPLDNSILEMNTCPFCSAKMEEVEE